MKSRKKRKVKNKRHSFLEISEQMGLPVTTVQQIHDEAMGKLRLMLLEDPYVKEWLLERKDLTEWNQDGNALTD